MAVETAIALNRFGLGARPDAVPLANPKRWLIDQMAKFDPRPAAISALPPRSELITAIKDLRVENRERKAAKAEGADAAEMQFNEYRKALRDQYVAAVDARLGVALASRQDFAERLVHFWANHFAISIDKIVTVGLAGNFEFEAIRPHIFGRFADLLKAASWHPAMLLYLDQAQSIGPNSMLAQRISAGRARNWTQRDSRPRNPAPPSTGRPNRL